MKSIYNEGRVVGLSAYELYVKHQLSQFPELPVLTEREWLADSIGNGSSMILKIASNTAEGIHDYPLPSDSLLCSPTSTLTASLFNGTVELDANNRWATKVTSYGPLISNTSTSNPSTPGNSKSTVPVGDVNTWDANNLNILKEYVKVIDGVAYQPGTWSNSSSSNPTKDFKPDYTKQPVIRLRIAKTITKDIYILFTGFIHTPIVAGLSMNDSSPLNSDHPENGDFLGASIFPWASKIIFTVPNEALNVLLYKAYSREFPDGEVNKVVDNTSIVDFESNNPGDYYKTNYTDSNVSLDVKGLNIVGSGASILGTYQRADKTSNGYTGANYPPVLYGARVTKAGVQTMSPVDVASPGTTKTFYNREQALNYPKVIPNVYSLYKDRSTDDIYIIDKSTTENDLIPITTTVKTENIGTASAPIYASSVTAKGVTAKAISLIKNDGTVLTRSTDNTSATLNSNYINWSSLLEALNQNKKIDLLGQWLRGIKSTGLLNLTTVGENNLSGSLNIGQTVKAVGSISSSSSVTAKNDVTSTTGKVIAAKGLQISDSIGDDSFDATTASTEFKFNKPVKSGANYITMSNGLRLYISNTEPDTTDVPIGSIGIGW